MAISLGSGSISALKLGSTTVTKAYLGSTLIYPTSGAILTVGVDGSGVAAGNHAGSYTVPQSSSTGSGTGAQFDITVTYQSSKDRSGMTAVSINASNAGSGYASGEIVTLDMSSVSGTWTAPTVEVLTVTA